MGAEKNTCCLCLCVQCETGVTQRWLVIVFMHSTAMSVIGLNNHRFMLFTERLHRSTWERLKAASISWSVTISGSLIYLHIDRSADRRIWLLHLHNFDYALLEAVLLFLDFFLLKIKQYFALCFSHILYFYFLPGVCFNYIFNYCH